MANTDPGEYRLQKNVGVIDASNPSKVIVVCPGRDKTPVQVTLDWREETYPNDDLPRLEGDTFGKLKQDQTSIPSKNQYGDLYIARSIVDKYVLRQGKSPDEFPEEPRYNLLRIKPLSLKLTAFTDNSLPSKEIELLLEENARIEDGLRFIDGIVEITLVESKVVDSDRQHDTPEEINAAR